MDNDTLRKVQLTMLEMLKVVDDICKKHNINYWLYAGTLLGAVRHNGFIPWDDDLDVGMLRDDYNKFMEVAQKELGDKYFLQNWDTDPGYALAFAKIRKNSTLYVEAGSENSRAHKGIYIDIFAFDTFPEDRKAFKNLKFHMEFLYRVMLVKYNYTPWMNDNGFSLKRWLIFLPIRFISHFYSASSLKRNYVKTVTAFNGTNGERVFESGLPHSEYYPVRRAVFLRTLRHRFENQNFPIPEGYDEFLRILYGDYMKLPPVEERENRHNIIKLKL